MEYGQAWLDYLAETEDVYDISRKLVERYGIVNVLGALADSFHDFSAEHPSPNPFEDTANDLVDVYEKVLERMKKLLPERYGAPSSIDG